MITIQAPAKLNLGLRLLGKRSDGYHNLDTIFISLDLFDDLTLSKRADDMITISCSHPAVPEDESNLVWQAAELARKAYGIREGLHIDIEKRIPVGGGMAGGSSDAAAVLRALPLLFGLEEDPRITRSAALQLGADVLYCCLGGVRRGRGIGTELEQIENNCRMPLAILPQPWPLNTGKVFGACGDTDKRDDFSMDRVAAALASGDPHHLGSSLGNSLQRGAFSVEPRLEAVFSRLEEAGFYVQMTGSGSTLYVVLAREDDLRRLKSMYKGEILVFSILNTLPSAIMKSK